MEDEPLCPEGIGGVAEMRYFQSTANEKDNVIKLNQVAYLYTVKVSLKSKACHSSCKMTLISYALKYYVVLKIYPPEASQMAPSGRLKMMFVVLFAVGNVGILVKMFKITIFLAVMV